MYNILICDDERDIVSALRIYLSAEGYRIFEAHTGKEALDIVAGHEIHLILMDIMMPEHGRYLCHSQAARGIQCTCDSFDGQKRRQR